MEPGCRIRVRFHQQFRYIPLTLQGETPCSARDLRRLLRVRDSVVDVKPLERCCLFRIDPQFLDLFPEELALFWMVVEAAGFHLLEPASDFLRRFLRA